MTEQADHSRDDHSAPLPKESTRAQPLRQLLGPLLEGRRARLGVVAIASLIGGLAEAGALVLVAQVAVAITNGSSDVALDAGPLDTTVAVPVLIGTAAGLVAARFFVALWCAWLQAALSSSLLVELRTEMFRKFLATSWSVQSREREGSLQEMMTTYASQATTVLGWLVQGITGLCTLATLVVAALLVNGVAALAVVAMIAILLLALLPFRNSVRRRSRLAAQSQLEFATALTESTTMAQEIRIFNVERVIQRKMEGAIEDHGTAFRRTRFLAGILPSIYQSAALLFLVLALALAYVVEPSNIASIGAVVLIMIRALSQGQLLQSTYSFLHESAPYLEQLEEQARTYSAAAVSSGARSVDRITQVSTTNVSYAYDGTHLVLRDVTFSVDSPEIVGIVGPSGSGKSTLVQILLRLREPTEGQLQVNGRDVRELDLAQWYDHVTLVPQEPRLFDGTVADNIRFFRPGVSDADLARVVRDSHLSGDIERWPAGLDTPVGGRGGMISGGQRQRLCLARALVDDPDIIVLDEPTSAVDAQSEALIRETLRELGRRKIVFVIAHRLSTLEICDRIMVLVGGEIQRLDRPDRLEADNEFYQEAVRLSGLR